MSEEKPTPKPEGPINVPDDFVFTWKLPVKAFQMVMDAVGEMPTKYGRPLANDAEAQFKEQVEASQLNS
jgi:hypothetical protein